MEQVTGGATEALAATQSAPDEPGPGSRPVVVRLYGPLRQAARCRELVLSSSAGSVGAALRGVAAQGELAAEMLFDREGRLRRSLIVLVNDEPAALREEALLRPGDVVSVLTPLAGG